MKTLAEQVGEEVMGYTMKWVDGSDWNEPAPETGWRVLVAEYDGLKFEWAPDENANDWWELVEKMSEKGWPHFQIARVRDVAAASFDGGVCTRRAPTLFEATCHAALAAVRGE